MHKLFFACSNPQRNCNQEVCFGCFEIDYFVVSRISYVLNVSPVIRLYRAKGENLIIIREVENFLNLPVEENVYKPIQELIFILAKDAN